jgi:PAS domain S-box-containing protein
MQSRLVWFALVLALLALLWGGRQIFDFQVGETQTRAQEQLQSIARLKVEQIAAWRKERLGDGEVLKNNALLTRRLLQGLDNPADAEIPKFLQDQLAEFQRQYGYRDHYLVDAHRTVRIHGGDRVTESLSTELLVAVEDAWRTHRATLSEIYLGTQHPYPHMALVVPLFEGDQAAGALLLVIDVRQSLDPLIQSWPIPSATAETHLVRRDGDAVLFLNELRHIPNAALSLRIPLSQSQVPAVQAVKGQTGLIEGPDYRGVPVLAVSLAIPESSWFLIAKVDRQEIYAEPRREALFLGGWLLSGFALLIGLPAFFWQRHKLRLKERLSRAEAAQMEAVEALKASEIKYALAFQSSPYAIVITRQNDGKILEVNPAFEILSGYPRQDAVGKTTPELGMWVDVQERDRFLTDIRQAGRVDQREYRFCRRDQSQFTGLLSARPFELHGETALLGSILDISERKLAEQALQAQAELREQLSQFADTVPGMMYTYRQRPDGTGFCPYISPRVEDIFGVRQQAAEQDAECLFAAIDADDRDRVLDSINHAALTLTPWQAEFRIHNPHRGVIWLHTVSTPKPEPDGGFLWYGFTIDITQRKHTERTLRLSEFSLENASDAVYWIRPDGSFLFCNAAASEMLGYNDDQLKHMSVADLNDEVQGAVWRDHFTDLQRQGHVLLETTHRTRDGRLIPVEVSANFITFEGAEYNCAIVRDITDRKRAEAAMEAYQLELEQRVEQRSQQLAKSEERFRLAMEATNDGLWDWKVQTGDCYYSPGWYRILGLEPGSLPARIDSFIGLLHPDERESMLAAVGQLLEGKSEYVIEFRMRHQAGGYVWVLSRGKVVQRDADGKPYRAVGTHIDTTERRHILEQLEDLNRNLEDKVAERTAQLQAANAAKSQFLAHMSHEIRTPMNAVLGLAQLLEKEPLEPGELAMVRHIRESGDSLLHIINDILDFSKIEAGQLRLDPQPFSVAEVLSHVDHLLRLTAEGKGLALEVRLSPTDLGLLMGDPLRLEQILINLVGNAIKFTAKGGVTVSAESVAMQENSARVRFEVRDTGIGIAPDVIGQLFKPFSQADASITRNFGGTGLGLAISRRLVDLMGGQMGVTSHAGQGSTFWFELPLLRASEQQAKADAVETQPAVAPAGPQLTGLRVLAVDDSRLNLMVVERALKLEGCSVTVAADGQQALQILTAQPHAFDVVLMDIQMPVMDGLTATREIRKDPVLARLPVIALTAGVLPEERQAALDAGVNDFLAKPLDLQTMTAMLAPYSRSSRDA